MKIDRTELVKKASDLKSQGYSYLVKLTAVDYEQHLEVIYILRNMKENKDETLEIDLDPADAWVPTLVGNFKAADWYEREMFEMFGIDVKGRNVERLLLEKWNGKAAPLRKNFTWNAPYETS
ncbi:MAG: NADH-quinone oxidoreductase subunit C [Candidatus Micrarchaeota archaeon]|nr:NADH-quinone oxidoreductase subunit C [Candidatus Micrarchaeota archaeon]